jgi:hypothetical protein
MILDQASANSGNLIGTNTSAHTATADCEAALHPAGRYCVSQRDDKVGIVV